MWVPFLCPFPGNEAHKLFSKGPKWGVLGGGQKVYVQKIYVLFPSPGFCLVCIKCRCSHVETIYLDGGPGAFVTPCPSFPCFFAIPCLFLPCEEFLVFSSVFPFFSRDFRGSVGIKNPCFFGGFPCLFPKKQGKEGQGKALVQTAFEASKLTIFFYTGIWEPPKLPWLKHDFWVHANGGIINGRVACVCATWRVFCAFLCVFALFHAFLRVLPAKTACKKAQLGAEFCKNVQKALLCNTPFSYTPFGVSPRFNLPVHGHHSASFFLCNEYTPADIQSSLSGATFSIEAPQNLLRTRRIYSKKLSSGKEFPFKSGSKLLGY